MNQPRINTSQIQYILSHKVLFEDFTPNKSYDKSIIIKHNNSLYLSKNAVEGKEEFDPNDWLKFANTEYLEVLIQEEKERAIAAESNLDNIKLDKISMVNKLYATNNNGAQTFVGYSTSNSINSIAQRDNNGQINIALSPTDNSHATSKKYVDDKINSAIYEAVVFKGIVDDETELPESGNTNGDMYWIRAFSDNPPIDMTTGRSGTAIYNGELGEFQFSEDAIYQPDDNTIELNSNGQLKVKISNENNNSLEIKNDGLFIDISEKVDKIHSASKVYVTDSNSDQSSISYDTVNSANTIAQRDNNSQLNVNLTPTDNSHATSKKYVDDVISGLETNKQDRPSSAIQDNIAVFDNNKDTVDSGKSFTTSISSEAVDTKIPTELAVKTSLDTKVDKTNSINQVYITSNIGEQTTIGYDTANTVSTIASRDNNGQINVNLTPTANTNATSKKYVDDAISGLETNKQDRPNSAVQNNIAIFNNNKDTIDSGKSFTTSISSEAVDTKIPTEKAVRTELDTKREKITTASKVYVTDSNSAQSSISYDTANTVSTIVQRDSNSQINIALSPTDNSHATSKKYVDDKIDTVITEAVVFKGIVADETLLPASGNINGDMYWITAYSDNPPTGMTPGVSGAAIYKKLEGQVGEWNYTQDSIYQPDGQTIELDSNGQLSVMISETANNSLVKNNDGLYIDISGKVDANTAITGATKTKITYDSKGLVTAGADLVESDIPSLHLSKISDITASVSEVNVLDGITATTTELNYVDGVTSSIQTQLDGKQATLVSGTNIKTINNNSILGSGNLDINGLPSQTGQSGKFLTTNGTTASWANVSQSLSGLSDTNISGVTNGQVLTYNNSSSKWVNQTYYAMVIEDFTAS